MNLDFINPFTFFTSSDITLSNKLLEVVYILIGLCSLYKGITSLKDEKNPHKIGTCIFWSILGIIMIFGKWIPPFFTGVLVVSMTIPAFLKKVSPGSSEKPDQEYTKKMFDKIGIKIFIPALSIGVVAIIFALFTKISPLVGVAVGVLISVILLMIYAPKTNTPKVFLEDQGRMLGVVGPLSMLPMLLACLGAVFTAAGVGDVIGEIVGNFVPEGNMVVGIIIYAIGMMLFTMIMGNAFAAITVMTTGIAGPFILAYGANPAIIVMVGLTCGFCGTLLTPMAANFNIVPVAVLEMKDKYGVIKNQIIPALVILVFQIIYMIIFS